MTMVNNSFIYLLQAGLFLQNPFAEKKGLLYLLPTLLKT